MHDQVLQDAPGADAGFEFGILGRRGRRLADIRRERTSRLNAILRTLLGTGAACGSG
jgi:hypothetical protein